MDKGCSSFPLDCTLIFHSSIMHSSITPCTPTASHTSQIRPKLSMDRPEVMLAMAATKRWEIEERHRRGKEEREQRELSECTFRLEKAGWRNGYRC